MDIKKVTLLGGGVLGSQIAFISAYWGYDVTFYMRSEGSITRTKPKVDHLKEVFTAELESARSACGNASARVAAALIPDIANTTPEQIDQYLKNVETAYQNLKYETDLEKSVADADLIIEAMAENPQQKIEMYTKMKPFMRDETILVTNSSTLLPSSFAEYTKNPANYLALHFANSIWRNNTAEIMGHAGTDQAAYDAVVAFAESIHMIPLQLHKEQPGYILNSMLVPFLNAAEQLWAKDVADPATIDLTWKCATGAPRGPFEIMDVVGLATLYNIGSMHPGADDPSTVQGQIMLRLKEKIDKGETGMSAGKGFYTY